MTIAATCCVLLIGITASHPIVSLAGIPSNLGDSFVKGKHFLSTLTREISCSQISARLILLIRTRHERPATSYASLSPPGCVRAAAVCSRVSSVARRYGLALHRPRHTKRLATKTGILRLDRSGDRHFRDFYVCRASPFAPNAA